ncbi:CGL117 [Auxenochlorella protothecoides x Auxenochlorella symbiontica]
MGDRRRPRSPSPDRYRRDRSPPYEKRFRGDEYDRGMGGGRGRRGGYARGPEDRRRTGRDEPVSFREFALSLDDSVGVEEAGVQYKQYLADFWGGSVKAEFEQRKNDPSLRQQFDPRELRKALEQRWEAVRAAAAAYAKQGSHADLDSLGPGPTGWRGRLAGEGGDARARQPPPPPPPPAPAAAASPSLAAADLELATALVAKLDAEAGVGAGGDDPAHPSGDHGPTAAAEAGNAGPEAGAGPASSGAAEAGDAAAAPDPEAVEADASPTPGPAAAAAAGEGVLERLDAARQYLWAVHGLDFYGARELGDAPEEARRAARLTQRREAAAPPAPASRGEPEAAEPSAADCDGEAAADAPAPDDAPPAPAGSEARDGSEAGAPGAAEAQAFQGRLHRHWQHRLDHGEAAQAAMREEYVEAGVTQFIEDAIVKHEDNKWGNKLSAKLFVAREFVEKHIRNKHAHVLQAERERLQDIVYWENFQSFKQEEKRRREEARGAGRQRGPQGARGMGRPRGGGRHGPEGGHMIFDQGMVMGPGGPGMLVPGLMMPGAGGAMPPVIMAPMNMVLGHMGAGGRGGGRGGNRGGKGGGGRGGFNGGPIFMAPGSGGKPGGPAPNQEYFDLDAPKNNRAVLDYGDL